MDIRIRDYEDTSVQQIVYTCFMLVSRDIVSPIRLSGGMNKSIPPEEINRYRVSPLKLK